MYRIEVNGQLLEAPDATITLNFQRSKIGEVTIAGDGSQTIQVPKTLNNLNTLGYCNFVESESVYPYSIHSCRVYQDELLLIDNADFTVLRTTSAAFECALTWGNSSLLNALKSIYMCEIPLGVYRKFPLGGARSAIDVKIYGEAFFFQTQDNEGVITDHYTTFKDVVGSDVWRDAVTGYKGLGSVLEQILSRAGLVYSFADATARDNFEASYVIDTAKSATIHKFRLHAIRADATIDIGRWENDGDHVTEYKRLYADDKEAYHVDEPYPGQLDDPNVYHELRDYYIPQDGYYNLTIKISYTQNQVGQPDGHGGFIQQSSSVNVVFAGGQMALYDNGAGFDRAVRSTEQDLNDTLDIRGDQTRMWIDADEVTDLIITKSKQFYKKGRHGLWLIGEGGLQTSYELARFTEVNVELTVTPYNGVEVDVVDEQECYLDHNFTYRDAIAYEVLSQTLKAFGLMAQLNANASTLELYTYNTIAAKAATGDVVDWSDKMIGTEDSIEYSLDLPQFLAFKWKAEAQYNGGKDTEHEILSTKEGRVEYLTNSIYSACNGMHNRPEEVVSIPLINYMSRKQDNPSVRELVNYVSGAKLVKLGDAVPYESVNVYLAEGNYIDASGSNFATADDSYFDYANTTDGIGANFKALLDALYKIVYIKVPMRLTPSDIASLDFTKPIYLQQYNAYFSLEKLQYGENGVSKVELIKLNLQ